MGTEKESVAKYYKEVVAKTYRLVMDIQRAWDPWDPTDYTVLKDVIDIHLHVNPGRINALACAKEACRAGMRAIVFKGILIPTVHLALQCDEIICDWAKEKGLRPVRVFGGPVLDKHVGGLNVALVKAMIAWGAKEIWMPVFSAANHLKNIGMPEDVVKRDGIYILKNGEVLPEVNEIINVVAESGVALVTGHLSIEEDLALIKKAKSAGVDKIIVDHPDSPLLGPIPREKQKEMVDKGAYLNIVINPGWFGLDPFEIIETIRQVGAENCILSSDVGMAWQASPLESLRSNIRCLRFLGLGDGELDIMTKKNPAKILGLVD